MIPIGKMVHKLAAQKGISIQELAKRMGVQKQTIYQMLKREDVQVSSLEKISAILDVPITYFFEEGQATSGSCPNCDNLRRELDLAYKYIEKLEGKCEKRAC